MTEDILTADHLKNRKTYAGASHGLASTHKDQLNADLLEFIRS
jgi:hypothetical protein